MTPSLSSGERAHALIAHQLSRLQSLRPQLLEDTDPEALHQFRVSLRRLRSLLHQFSPALILPPKLSSPRIAALARVSGGCRDADVLQEHLERLRPQLEPVGQSSCRTLLRHIRKERRQCFADLESSLTSRGAKRLFERLQSWVEAPLFTDLGRLALEDWLQEWLLAATGSAFLHGGWFATRADDPGVHALRKRLKEVRYGLEALQPWLGRDAGPWITAMRSAQDCLGTLHDLEVLLQKLTQALQPPDDTAAAALRIPLQRLRQQSWHQWLELKQGLLLPQRRRTLICLVPATPSSGDQAPDQRVPS